jgi:hypothetical protein
MSAVCINLQKKCTKYGKLIISCNKKMGILSLHPQEFKRGSVLNYESKIRTVPLNLNNYQAALKGIEHLEFSVLGLKSQNKLKLKKFQRRFMLLTSLYKSALKRLKDLSSAQPTPLLLAPVSFAQAPATVAPPSTTTGLDLGDKISVKCYDGNLVEPKQSPHAFIISINPPNTVVDKNGQPILLVTYNITLLVPIVFDGALRERGEEIRMVYPIFLQKCISM